ncbi:oxidoreductase domain-containing protein [Massilia sp. WF1]|uniref:Rossmann-like and DUF2520 domain-containing protein n=1 Tax=unclassified Massilia TaxID=2609279 RepID=UPI00068B2B07|nr:MULTISPECIES: Rossmann-like and DUF2520 domain-containing protein [unclassified Massilia]ALK95143.1 oxidoreductase [Massilia sp. WG5]KNZ67528.1 oxidoreductase domain-containing protein [Massilia sp. WF1]
MSASLNIVGAGHVGRALGRLFAARGVLPVQDVLTRSHASAQAAVAFIGAGRVVDAVEALRPASVWMLAVLDDRIAGVAQQLAARGDLAGAVVFHCSGAKASSELEPLRAAGALVASVHPVRSFADPRQVADAFDGTFCGVEGDPEALAVLTPAFAAIGARVVPIDASAKTVYHAASVFASNYLTTVLDAALRAYQAAGIPAEVARELARPLASETLANVFRLGPETALSGPIARGDAATVARQQDAVNAWDPATGALYEALAAATWDLARRRNIHS